MDRQITTLSKDQVRANLQGLIDSGELKGIRSDGVNTNMAVDTLSRPADARVDRGAEAVNDFQERGASPALQADISSALATPPPQALTPDQGRTELERLRQDIAGTDVAQDRRQIREDLQIAEKEERARTLSNQLVARERAIQQEIERMERNPEGQSRAGLNAELNRFRREASRELADMSFSYQVALGDFQAAEKIAQDYMNDLQQELALKQQTFQNLFTLVQNDMTASEQLMATQAFQYQMMREQVDLGRETAQFLQTLQQQDPMYQASLANTRLQGALLQHQIDAANQPILNNPEANQELVRTQAYKDAETLARVGLQIEGQMNLFGGTAEVTEFNWEEGAKNTAFVEEMVNLIVRARNPDIVRVGTDGAETIADTAAYDRLVQQTRKTIGGVNVNSSLLRNGVQVAQSNINAGQQRLIITQQDIARRHGMDVSNLPQVFTPSISAVESWYQQQLPPPTDSPLNAVQNAVHDFLRRGF